VSLPESLEAEASNITVNWYRATTTRKIGLGSSYDPIPEGALGWVRMIAPNWAVFTPEEHGGWPGRISLTLTSVRIDMDDYVQQTYILPDSYWASVSDE